ncbi:hypothetical protein BV20DRAFT_1005550 [Pilatotrama ljubarskyi]|nr:hypothetical protein BV20DRAFT_1005550 [Pilatotrama ljubarskyi]
MPHKRAKRSLREKKRVESGNDLVPGVKKSIEAEEIPKSVARVLNAAKIQQEWAEKKKRKAQAEDGAGPSRKKRRKESANGEVEGGSGRTQLRIQPGESIAHFNRRVEDSMRYSVREAMQTSSAKMRRARKEELEGKTAKASPATKARSRSRGHSDDDGSDSENDRPASSRRPTAKDDKPRDFEKISTSAPRRLNDIVQAPPELKKLPRKAKKMAAEGSSQKTEGAKSLKEGVLSMAQKAMMEEERERAIRLYREMKRGKAPA